MTDIPPDGVSQSANLQFVGTGIAIFLFMTETSIIVILILVIVSVRMKKKKKSCPSMDSMNVSENPAYATSFDIPDNPTYDDIAGE